ncbi:MAG: hypothetical protein OEQ39_18155 [Gammaproteobacteria bacterium]|nr:hypothetical protein [Gammaproteobacteria bacterium]
MKCLIHSNEVTIICPSCGKGLCPDCSVVSTTARNACSEECINNLNTLDEAAILSVTKAKKTLKANVTFGRFLGIIFILVGIISLIILGKDFTVLSLFMGIMGVAFVLGAQIYAYALKEK